MSKFKYSILFDRLVSLNYLPRWGVLLIDLMLSLVAFTISFLIGFQLLGYNIISAHLLPAWQQAAILLCVQTACFWLFHSYAGILRYSTFMDMIRVILAVVLAGALLLSANALLAHLGDKLFLNSLIVIYVFVNIVLLFVWRVTIKTSFEFLSHQGGRSEKVLIYGVRSAGLSIAKMLHSNLESPYRPVGFITDEKEKEDHDLLGLRVYPRNRKTIAYMKEHNIRYVIISPIKMAQLNPLTDLNIFIDNGIKILYTPHFTDFEQDPSKALDADIARRIGTIESIKVEDLLERPAISINTENVHQILTDRVVMVTGAAGSIGSEIVRQVAKYQCRLIVLFEMAESPLHDLSMDLKQDFPNQQFIRLIGDVRNAQMVEEAFAEYHPDVVFHAAAYKHVPLMEEFPAQAVLTNVLGTKNVADMAVKYNTKRFVMISTDKAVNPTNVMGASKRIAEIYVQSLFYHLQNDNPDCTKFITTRFGNVLGSSGSVVPFFKKQIAAGGPVTVTHPDIIRYFMTIPEASSLVLEAATLGNGGEIFCFDMGAPVRIADLAKNMIRLAGYEPGKDISIVYTGLRPGEKLYEELLNRKESTLPTPNEKIKIAKVRRFDYDTVATQMNELIDEARTGKVFPTVRLMKQMVPEYKSRNSVYEQLD